MTDKSCEAFEALCKIEGVSVAKDPEPVCYSSAKTRLALQFWQAGRKQRIKAEPAQSEPQSAFCPACFEAVALDECYAEARDAKLWREHAAGLTASSEMVPLLDGEWLARRTDEAYQQGLRAAPEGDSKYKALYEDLIFQVSHKFKDETRHQTAKRYIASWEGRSLQPESAKQSEPLKCSL